jgi:hypothetical protein
MEQSTAPTPVPTAPPPGFTDHGRATINTGPPAHHPIASTNQVVKENAAASYQRQSIKLCTTWCLIYDLPAPATVTAAFR